jgi:DNA-binding GntR family transcriptional regulator
MLNLKSLREQIYDHLRKEMQTGKLFPGSLINITEISQQLGISKTPLRDALIQMEVEGFVTILARRGIEVNKLSIEDVKNAYQIVGALEATSIVSAFDKFKPTHISKMKLLNTNMRKAVNKDNFDLYYTLNDELHKMFLDFSDNTHLIKLVTPIKQRLYDFPRRGYITEWELSNCDEHQQIIELIQKGDPEGAAKILKDVHWSYDVQKEFIRRFYSVSNQ